MLTSICFHVYIDVKLQKFCCCLCHTEAIPNGSTTLAQKSERIGCAVENRSIHHSGRLKSRHLWRIRQCETYTHLAVNLKGHDIARFS
jgi:hypothetical protein